MQGQILHCSRTGKFPEQASVVRSTGYGVIGNGEVVTVVDTGEGHVTKRHTIQVNILCLSKVLIPITGSLRQII